MEILYVGYALENESYYNNKAASLAAGRFEKGLLSGFKNGQSNIEVVTSEPNSYYPKAKFFITKKKLNISNDIVSTRLFYINVPIIKHLTLGVSLLVECLRWMYKKRNSKRVIISYNMDTPILQVLLFVQKIGIKYVPIICDLPFYEEVEHSRKGIRQHLSSLAHKSQFKNISMPAGLIILNENVKKDFSIIKTILIEGGVSEQDIKEKVEKTEQNDKFILFYSGSIDIFHGSDKILSIAKRLDPHRFTFIVCGRGEEWAEIFEQNTTETSVLQYKGVVSNEELATLQSNADLLLIPHPTSLKQLRYQFPSKMMDYMLTGVPVLTTPLPGLPDEYRKYVYYTNTDNEKDLFQEILNISQIDFDKRNEKGLKARDFVINEKNWDINTNKILNFFRNEIL